MGLFSDIYNTVAKFFRPAEEDGEASKSVAANRLKLVLMQDRTNLTPKILEQMRGELIDLLSKYVELDKELLELNFEQEGDQVALMLSIPVIRAKDEEEIEAAIKASKENETEESEDTEETSEDNDNTEIVDNSEISEEENTKEPENTTEKDNLEESEKTKKNESSEDNSNKVSQEIVSASGGRIIKKKKVSAPEGINPFKQEDTDKKSEIPSES